LIGRFEKQDHLRDFVAFGPGRVEEAERHIDRLVIDKPAGSAAERPNFKVGGQGRTDEPYGENRGCTDSNTAGAA
ncbi:MAG: hypothetical protein CVT71_03000, partial [Alphaproteobacteria bacterium HGW-Alphaproteobacteria-10]